MTITGQTQLTALLGSPVAHSISPLMHNESFRLLGLNYVYLCFEVNETNLSSAVSGLKTIGIRGFNLTMPNKTKILDYLDDLSPAARLIGSANTVCNDSGKLTGYNTDGCGFMQSVTDAGHNIIGKTITIMGAGGAAAAICAQAALDGVKAIHIFARPTSRYWTRTEELTEKINQTTLCKATLYPQEDYLQLKHALTESTMLINGTSVGMSPNTDQSILPDTSYLHPELIVSDIIYNPRETKLLTTAKGLGCQTFNGLYMLLYQGAQAFQIWTGKKMPVNKIKEKFFQ